MISSKWVEVTTRVGCANMCSYCPQDALTKVYRGKMLMSLEDFRVILGNVDRETTQIHFSGFSESFLTKDSERMMVEGYKAGYSVVLFTTLEGFTEEKAKVLHEGGVKFSSVSFHEYDGAGFNAASFKEKIDLFKSMCSSDEYTVSKITAPASRGGHLREMGPFYGPLYCSRFDCNVVLPNGDLHLCCSDWSLKHRIGNLYERHYDDLVHISERNRLRVQALQQESDILCRTCEWAQSVPQELANRWLGVV